MRIALIICLPLAGLLGALSSRFDWSVGAVYGGFAVIAVLAHMILLRGVPRPPTR